MKLNIAAALLQIFSFASVTAQQVGTYMNEGNPTITLKECTIADGCTSRQAKLTLDANWRWIHHTEGSTNCYTGNQWNQQYCSDPVECAQQCALEGISKDKYRTTYGIQQVQNGVKMRFKTDHQYGTNVGSRLYVMDEGADDDKYKLFFLKNREFSFDVDVSELMCGMNGAMYFSEMAADGGLGLGNNQAGAKYGTGYCDAQCPHDIKFIDGEANTIDWKPNPLDKSNNMGIGKYGACCAEMDIWEANSMATAYTPHTCGEPGQYRCDGIDCGDNDKGQRYNGVCDKDGCDINPYRMGNPDFYGRGRQYAVDTTRPMKVVTQFLTTDGTDDGDLSEIRRFYVQDGNIIHSPSSTILGEHDTDSITDGFCDAKKDLFGDVKHYQELGGMKGMGESLDRGHVMIFSLWDDVHVNMLWLDSAYPLNKPVTDPGIKRGDCVGGHESTPEYLRQTYPDSYVTFKNAAVGEIGSTVGPVTPTTQSPTRPIVPTKPPSYPPSSNEGYCNYQGCNGEIQGGDWCNNSRANCEGNCSGTWCTNNPAPTTSPVAATSGPTKTPTSSPSLGPTMQPVPVTEEPTSGPTHKPTPCADVPSNQFFFRMKTTVDPAEPVYKSCSWLMGKDEVKRGRICTKKTDSYGGYGPPKDVCKVACGTCDVTDEPTVSPTKSATNEPTVNPTDLTTEMQTRSPTKNPTKAPTPSSPCCSQDFRTCPDDMASWCNQSEGNCQQCGGVMITGAPLQCIGKWGECTNDINGCCSPASCQGSGGYKQCLN